MFPKARVWRESYPKCMLRIDSVNYKYSLHVAQNMDEEHHILGCCANWDGRLTDRACRDGNGRLSGAIVHCIDGHIGRVRNATCSIRMPVIGKNHGGVDHIWIIYGHEKNPMAGLARLRNMLCNANYILFGDGNGGTLGNVEKVTRLTQWFNMPMVSVYELSGGYAISDIVITPTTDNSLPRDEEQIDRD